MITRNEAAKFIVENTTEGEMVMISESEVETIDYIKGLI